MKEVFQSYGHYTNWISNNWESVSREMDNKIIEAELVIEKQHSCNGETHRSLTQQEFFNKEANGFIFVPSITEPHSHE